VSSAGITYLVELYDCPPEVLNDDKHIETVIREAVDHANATLLDQATRRFEPQGVTSFALLAESHVSIHTWPELGYAAADIFTCGNHAMPEAACEYLVGALEPSRHSISRVARGARLAPRVKDVVTEPSPAAAGRA